MGYWPKPWKGLRSRARRVVRACRDPAQRLRYRQSVSALTGPGYAGFEGGAFNPGVVTHADGSCTAVFKGQDMHWMHALNEAPDQFMRGGVMLWQMSSPTASPPAPMPIELLDSPEGCWQSEDFRLFEHQGSIYANHPSSVLSPGRGRIDRQTLSVLDVDAGTLRRLGEPSVDFSTSHRERNWVYHSDGDTLYLLYSIEPYRVLVLSDLANLTFETLHMTPAPSALRDPGGSGRMVSFSTNPVGYDDEHLFLLTHQIQTDRGMRRYQHWGVLIHRRTMRIAARTSAPLFDGYHARGMLPGVFYISAVVPTDNDLVFFGGEGDSHISRCIVSRARIDALWQPTTDAA